MLADPHRLTTFIRERIADGVAPGAVVGIVTPTDVVYREAFGDAQIEPERRAITTETVFDVASLTKVVATTTAILQLVERGELSLWDELSTVYDDVPLEKADISLFQLLTHTAGFKPYIQLEDDPDRAGAMRAILAAPLRHEPGARVTYTDLGFILLADVVRETTGQPFDEYVRQQICEPLGLTRTGFVPDETMPPGTEFAATERSDARGGVLCGSVHDPRAASLGGVSGHAGLFSTIDDLCIFVRAILNGGRLDDERLLGRRTVELMRRNHTPEAETRRGLGWDLRNQTSYSSSGALFGDRSFGHTGFTGTSIWIDPDRDLGVVLLTNRVHPSRDNERIQEFRPRLHNLVATCWDESSAG